MNLTSNIGAKFDLFADFIYVMGAAGILIYINYLPFWFVFVLILSFLVFMLTSKIIATMRRSNIQQSIVFDRIGKTTAILTMLLPGLFIFRDSINDAVWVMRIGSYVISGLFGISIVYRIMLSSRVKS